MRRLLFLLSMLCLLSVCIQPLSSAARAEGIIIPPEPRFPAPALKSQKIDVSITDQVAKTVVEQVFVNDAGTETEGIYLFPLPAGAAVSNFTMWADGRVLEGQILDKDEARSRYEEIVRQRRDPALLEYVGDDLFQASIFPIPPHGERKIRIEYSQVLKLDEGLVSYVFPLHGAGLGGAQADMTISVDVQSKQPVQTLYSPTHDLTVKKESDRHVTASYEGQTGGSSGDFVLYYAVGGDNVAMNLLTYRTGDEDGYFLLLVSPPASVQDEQVVARDIALVLDVSGSMEGEKLDQAKQALQFVLNRLNLEDRFNVFSFSSYVDSFADSLQPVSRVDDARRWVDGLAAGGGTNIDEALQAALRQAKGSERPFILIFLTDGLPTVGVDDVSQIMENVKRTAPATSRIFAFGVGYDVNTVLLDGLAQENSGTSDYVAPGESIEERVSRFYSKIGRPVLTGLELDFGQARVREVLPSPLPDLFAGGQLVITGRYSGEATADLTLRGKSSGKEQVYEFKDQAFPEFSTESPFVPQLWAARKVGYLLSEIKLHGENEELVKELIDLSLRYGIVTPYTSYFVEEQNDVLTQEGRDSIIPSISQSASEAPAMGAGAVANSKAANDLAQSQSVQSGGVSQMKSILDKTFLLRNGVWTDTTYDGRSSTTKVGFSSGEYFDLIAAHPEWAQYLSAGSDMIVVLDDKAYEISGGQQPGQEGETATSTPEPGQTGSGAGTAGHDTSSSGGQSTTGGYQRNALDLLLPVGLAGIVVLGGFGLVLTFRRRA